MSYPAESWLTLLISLLSFLFFLTCAVKAMLGVVCFYLLARISVSLSSSLLYLSPSLSVLILWQQESHPCRRQVFWGLNDCLLPNGNKGSPAEPWSFPDWGALHNWAQPTADQLTLPTFPSRARSSRWHGLYFFHPSLTSPSASPLLGHRAPLPSLCAVVCLFTLIIKCLSGKTSDFPSTQTVMQQHSLS